MKDIEQMATESQRQSTPYQASPHFYKHQPDDTIVIDFESDLVGPFEAIDINPYVEDGFTLTSTPGGTYGIVLADKLFDNINFPEIQPALQAVNQEPGHVVGGADLSSDDLVVARTDGEDFEFKGGHFSFANVAAGAINLKNVRITFEGYRDGTLIDSFTTRIHDQGGFITSKLDDDIDCLIIRDGQAEGWLYADNLIFETPG